ncbi:serine hydrolase domain-containing protein [Alicyclobacillus fodiniaquatilis]|uniref:Serine hydrolase domain-containing protein n=1 Tax=Alicyclobacillus fodiniaquatilis TaxID=1661150 RepID=A0ABW4JHX9_9BACL
MKLVEERLKLISPLLEKQIEQENIPGAVVAAGIGRDTHYLAAFGYAENQNRVARKMEIDTLFDLASLTKVVATLPAILSLIDDGEIRLNDPVQLFIPEFPDTAKPAVTIRHLLTHTAGLAPHRKFYQLFDSQAQIRTALRQEAPIREPGAHTEYSDISFLLLGEIVQAVSGKPLEGFVRERIFSPLNMAKTMFCPPASLYEKIAATEHGKVGVVHDENANALGGVAGHAGLFAPVADLMAYIAMWLGHTPLLSEAVRKLAVQNQTAGLAGNRGLGWVCRHDPYDHAGDLWPETTVGHTGFTGTSIAFDPASGLWLIILTNAVHYGREKKAIIRLRGLLHNLVGSAIVMG